MVDHIPLQPNSCGNEVLEQVQHHLLGYFKFSISQLLFLALALVVLPHIVGLSAGLHILGVFLLEVERKDAANLLLFGDSLVSNGLRNVTCYRLAHHQKAMLTCFVLEHCHGSLGDPNSVSEAFYRLMGRSELLVWPLGSLYGVLLDTKGVCSVLIVGLLLDGGFV